MVVADPPRTSYPETAMPITEVAKLAKDQLQERALRAGGARFVGADSVADAARSAAGKASAAQQAAAGLSWSARRWWGLDPVKAAVAALHQQMVEEEAAAGLGRILALYAARSEWADTAAAKEIGLPISCRHPVIGRGNKDPWGGEAVQDDNGAWVSPLDLHQWIEGMARSH